MLFYGWGPLMVSHHPAKFGDHSYCGSGDVTFLVAEEREIPDALAAIHHYCLF